MTPEAERKAIARYERQLEKQRERRRTDPEYRAKKAREHRAWSEANRDRLNAYQKRWKEHRRVEKAGAADAVVSQDV